MNHFSRAVRGKNLLYVSKGGVVDLIYPNEPSIESLQLMFGAEEKEEICRKWVFMIRKVKLIMFLLFSFLKKVLNRQKLFMIF
uniref:Ribosomal protein s16 n=1 Tax=Chenopodium album TaxID=3559 RepID=A0A291S7U1_CHEAL|nr:ribosomal protein s16 [Chenopodium album]